MARLTRTQKYANLREQLSSSKEENTVSQDLTSFQDRLNTIEDTLSPTQEVFANVVEEIKEPEQKVETNPNYIWNPFPDDVLNQPEKEIWEPVADFDQEDKYIKPVLEEKQLEEEKPSESFFDKLVNLGTNAEENAEIQDVPAFEQPAFVGDTSENKKEESYFDSFIGTSSNNDNQNDSFNSYFEAAPETEQKQSIEEIYSNVFSDVKDDSGEIVTIKERDTYLNQTISDVNSHNINNGLKTIDQIVDDSVDAIRHPEGKPLEEAELIEVVEENPTENTVLEENVPSDISTNSDSVEEISPEETIPYETSIEETITEEVPAEEQALNSTFVLEEQAQVELDADEVIEPIIDDEEFSNTVSMEISKIMDEISNIPAQEEKQESAIESFKNDELVDSFKETISIDETVNEETAEDVVEIKNISEMDAEPAKDTMSSTIPFIVAADDEEELLEEEDEDDGSNTVLNVILIVLIVVLVAVLGLIVFYILKTKGIF